MIILLVTLPVIASLSLIGFHSMNLTVINYEKKKVPYSLGAVILYSYALLHTFPPEPAPSLSFFSYIYILGVWLLGLIDDVFGKAYPKGLKGHFLYSLRTRVITTGLLKAFGTVILALLYLWMNGSNTFLLNLVSFLLLTGLPHVMNLFDTRPLRVWKVALCMTMIFLVFSPLPSFLFVITLLAVFYITFILEGDRKAMLGDNGATVIGAIMAVVVINQMGFNVQLSILAVMLLIIILAEKWSISSMIERSVFLKTLDKIGISRK